MPNMAIWRYRPGSWCEPLLFTRTNPYRYGDEAIFIGPDVSATIHIPRDRHRGRRRPPRDWDYDSDSGYSSSSSWSEDSETIFCPAPPRCRAGRRGGGWNINRTANINMPVNTSRACANAMNRVVVNNIYRPPRHWY